MNGRSKKITGLVMLASAMFLWAGCSGGGSGTAAGGGGTGTGATVTGLTIANKVSVVDAQQTTTNSQLVSALRRLAALSSVPADSDYNNDRTNIYVAPVDLLYLVPRKPQVLSHVFHSQNATPFPIRGWSDILSAQGDENGNSALS